MKSAALKQITGARSGAAAPASCTPEPCYPNQAGGYLPHPLFFEGQGNGDATWTCGPSATRNLIAGITGTDYGEAQFATWENDQTGQGTPIGNIKGTLNKWFGDSTGGHHGYWGTWNVSTPGSATDLESDIVTDVNLWDHQSVILNVATQYLKFWDGTADGHYDLGDSYDIALGSLGVADEWDHANSDGVNPFGFHSAIPAPQVYSAVSHSTSTQIVY